MTNGLFRLTRSKFEHDTPLAHLSNGVPPSPHQLMTLIPVKKEREHNGTNKNMNQAILERPFSRRQMSSFLFLVTKVLLAILPRDTVSATIRSTFRKRLLVRLKLESAFLSLVSLTRRFRSTDKEKSLGFGQSHLRICAKIRPSNIGKTSSSQVISS